MKRILILNGSPRRNGSTAKLVKAFTEGAESAGNEVKELYLYSLNVNDCIGCEGCRRKEKNDEPNPCTQMDDMEKVYKAFRQADIIVFASPIYYWTITGKLKTVVDRLYAMIPSLGMDGYKRSSILLATAAGSDYRLATEWHQNFNRITNWDILGNVLGSGKENEAKALGESIK